MRNRYIRFLSARDHGQALALTAVGLLVLLGFAGLAIDMGALRYERRLQQTAADAAAIAGASDINRGGVVLAAQHASGANGFSIFGSDGGTTGSAQISDCTNADAALGMVCVEVHNPPTTGPHTGDGSYVEALVAAVHPTYFMKAFGVTKSPVVARAVATYTGAQGGCLYALGSVGDSIQGINVGGSAILNAPTCGINDNGDFNTNGNKLQVDAGTFAVSGTWTDKGTSTSKITCGSGQSSCPMTGTPAVSDPLALASPCPGSVSCGGEKGAVSISGSGFTGNGVTFSNGTFYIEPGSYTSISIQGTPGGGTAHGCTTMGPSVTLNPGVYAFTGTGLSITGNAVIRGTGVMFYFTNTATVGITGTPDINLSAPTSGTYNGILMYQDPADTNTGPFPGGPTLSGDDCSKYNGALYFPSDQLTFTGDNTTTVTGMVVVDSVVLTGNCTVNLEGRAGLTAPVKTIALVE